MKTGQVHELLYQALETEINGREVYLTAIECAQDDDLRSEWQGYLDETVRHQEVLREVFAEIGLDPEVTTPGRKVVRHKALSLINAMKMARAEGGPGAAQLVAAECVVEAETKDHQNWELIGRVADAASGKLASALKAAYDEVSDQEAEHLYHTMGWARELWIQSLGMPAVIPPPEEEKSVKTAIGAARAEQAREEMLAS